MDIQISHLTKTYGEKIVLSDFSAIIKSGQRNVVIGPSGCGKTTFARILAGLCPADDGQITNMPKRLSMMFQEDRLCESFSAYENLVLVLGKKDERRQFDFILQEAQKLLLQSEDLKRPVKALSGGMRRRIALLRAMLFDARLVILDEPFKGLDVLTKEKTMQYVWENTTGKTLILITHDKSEQEYFGEHVIEIPFFHRNENQE